MCFYLLLERYNELIERRLTQASETRRSDRCVTRASCSVDRFAATAAAQASSFGRTRPEER